MRELDWLILRKLYEKRSISKAAEDLYVTQSALTKRVRTIEQEWGVEVVKRSNQGVTFTEDGRYLVKKAGIMLDFLGEIREHFSERHGVKELVRVGVPNSFARLHMPKLLKGYVDAYNRLQFKTFPNSSDMLIRQITDGTIDIAIVCGDYPFLGEKICLFEEELYIMAPMGTALEDVEHLPIIVFKSDGKIAAQPVVEGSLWRISPCRSFRPIFGYRDRDGRKWTWHLLPLRLRLGV